MSTDDAMLFRIPGLDGGPGITIPPEARHEGVVALSTKRQAPADVPGAVNTHPGPDLDILRRVRDGLLNLPASTEGSKVA